VQTLDLTCQPGGVHSQAEADRPLAPGNPDAEDRVKGAALSK